MSHLHASLMPVLKYNDIAPQNNCLLIPKRTNKFVEQKRFCAKLSNGVERISGFFFFLVKITSQKKCSKSLAN